jgi:hypothetical protein
VVDGADLEVKGIDLEAEGLVRGSSSEREASQKEKWRHTMARRSSEAMGGGGMASSDQESSRVGWRRRREASHSLG